MASLSDMTILQERSGSARPSTCGAAHMLGTDRSSIRSWRSPCPPRRRATADRSASGASPHRQAPPLARRRHGVEDREVFRQGGDNPLAASSTYGYVPSALRLGGSGHHVILHYWLDQYLGMHGQGAV